MHGVQKDIFKTLQGLIWAPAPDQANVDSTFKDKVFPKFAAIDKHLNGRKFLTGNEVK